MHCIHLSQIIVINFLSTIIILKSHGVLTHAFVSVTIDDIQQFERVYAGIKKAHEQQIKSNANLCAAVEVNR